MTDEQNVEKIEYEGGIGIWGNKECVQCGACCYEYSKCLYEKGMIKTEECENFEIKDGRAFCLNHDGEREQICEKYFCGNVQPILRFRYGGDKNIRAIAEELGTTPENYKIPVLLPLNVV